jgi:hypothetical protein
MTAKSCDGKQQSLVSALTDACALIDGWNQGECWSEWDADVRRRLGEELAKLALSEKKPDMPPIGDCHCPNPDDCLYGGPACPNGEERKRRRDDSSTFQSANTPSIPAVLFDGYAVYESMGKPDDVSPRNVAAVLDAVVRLIRAGK